MNTNLHNISLIAHLLIIDIYIYSYRKYTVDTTNRYLSTYNNCIVKSVILELLVMTE